MDVQGKKAEKKLKRDLEDRHIIFRMWTNPKGMNKQALKTFEPLSAIQGFKRCREFNGLQIL